MSNIFTRKRYDTNQVKSSELSNDTFNRHIMNDKSLLKIKMDVLIHTYQVKEEVKYQDH